MEAGTTQTLVSQEETQKNSGSEKAGRYVVLKKVGEDSYLLVDRVSAPNGKSAVRQVSVERDGSLSEGTYVPVPLSSFKEFTPKLKQNITWE